MILRNKKTGKLGHLLTTKGLSTYDIIDDVYNLLAKYSSLAKLCADWEDYKPTEPLIEDENDPERAEKIREAIRTWAEVLHIDQDNIKISIGSHRTSIVGWQPGLIGGYSIDFPNILKELHDGMQTTITELCGEEEE